jgi:hypothetical protein
MSDPDLFEGYETTAEVIGYIVQQEEDGEAIAQALLKALIDEMVVTKDDLEKAVAELEQAGLPAVAALVQEAAEQAPPKSQRNPFDPVTERAKYIDWQRRECGDWSGFMAANEERLARGRAMGLIQ